MNIIAFDPATACGWATLDEFGNTNWGTWDLTPDRHQGPGDRFWKLWQMLPQMPVYDLLVYEKTFNSKFVLATMIQAGIVAILQMWASRHGLKPHEVQATTIKKHATGSGRADKEMMLEAARKKWGPKVRNHNEADALWVLDYAHKHLTAELAQSPKSENP